MPIRMYTKNYRVSPTASRISGNPCPVNFDSEIIGMVKNVFLNVIYIKIILKVLYDENF